MYEGKRGERRIVSRKGVPVEIIGNPDSEHHAAKTTLAVGGIDVVKNLKEASWEEADALTLRRHALNDEIHQAVLAKVREEHREIPSNFVPDGVGERPMHKEYYIVYQEYLRNHPEVEEEVKALKQAGYAARNKQYEFAEDSRRMDDVHVGKEGTLVYSRVPGENIAKEIVYRLNKAKEVLAAVKEHPSEAMKYRMNFRAMNNPPDPAVLEVLLERLEKANGVADIHQVEVLPAAQKKGIASALLDVANWDIAEAKDLQFTIARVLDSNHEQEKVLGMFEKDGFLKIYCPGNPGGAMSGETPNYYLLVKENKK